MSLSGNNLYEFGKFRLDIREKILWRGDQPVELLPKGFELLTVFVENHGRLLEKDELMDRLWADSFVEESNLTFNIRQFCKILADEAHAPRQIIALGNEKPAVRLCQFRRTAKRSRSCKADGCTTRFC